MLDRATRWFLRFRDRDDLAALGRLFDHAAPELLRIARNLTRELTDAEDLVQTTFLLAIESAPRFDRGKRVLPWLGAILTHAAHAERRRRQRAPQDGDDVDLRPDGARGPADAAAGRELEQQTRDALERLPEPYRQPTLLRVAHGLPPAEIALLLGRSPGTVRAQIHRGLAQLRERLPAGAFAPALFGGELVGRGLPSVKAAVLAHAAKHTATAAIPTTLTGAFVMSKKTLAVAVLALAGLAFALPRGKHDADPSIPVDTLAARVDTALPRDPAPEAARSIASRRCAWTVVDDLGAPVGNARVRIDGSDHASADDGTGACDLLTEGADATAACEQHEPWSGRLVADADNRIVLARSPSACVTALDEDGAPVRGATVWLANDWLSIDALRQAGAPHATTDADGKARFRGLSAGRYRIHARHDLLVFSHLAQDLDADRSPGHILCSVPGGDEVITLSQPYVLAYQVDRAAEARCQILSTGAEMHRPRNADGQETLQRLEANLYEQFPAASFSMRVRDPHARGEPLPPNAKNELLAQAPGHAPIRAALTPVRFLDFIAPVFADPWSAPASDDFGTVTVWVGEPGPGAIDGLEFRLDRFRAKPGQDSFLPGTPMRTGQATVVPIDQYVLHATEPVVDALAQKEPRFVLAKGEQKTIVLGRGLAWTTVHIGIAPAPELPTRVFAGGLPVYVRIRLRETNVTAMKGFNTRSGVDVLVPAGEMEFLITLPSDHAGMLWAGNRSVTVGPDARGPFEVALREIRRDDLKLNEADPLPK